MWGWRLSCTKGRCTCNSSTTHLVDIAHALPQPSLPPVSGITIQNVPKIKSRRPHCKELLGRFALRSRTTSAVFTVLRSSGDDELCRKARGDDVCLPLCCKYLMQDFLGRTGPPNFSGSTTTRLRSPNISTTWIQSKSRSRRSRACNHRRTQSKVCASPRLASPRLASPRLASPRLAALAKEMRNACV